MRRMKSDLQKNSLLALIGERVRSIRLRQELTVKEFAERASLSPRFVNQLEAGEGNISIAGLARVATALECSLFELMPPQGDERSIRARVLRLVTESDDDNLREVIQLLNSRQNGIASRKSIALIGLRGAGKSTIGPVLAKRLKTQFVELDKWIERAAGLAIGEIFTTHGESYYRRLEREALNNVFAQTESCVLAPGGSIVTDPESWELIKRRCFTVWLHATPDEFMRRMHKQGDTRAMQGRPAAMDELKALLARREPLYSESQVTIKTTSKSLDKVIEQILRRTAR
jgi:XRE family aerobic/anaerobic benzoate catabolism transcriptional regulator